MYMITTGALFPVLNLSESTDRFDGIQPSILDVVFLAKQSLKTRAMLLVCRNVSSDRMRLSVATDYKKLPKVVWQQRQISFLWGTPNVYSASTFDNIKGFYRLKLFGVNHPTIYSIANVTISCGRKTLHNTLVLSLRWCCHRFFDSNQT